MNYSQNRSMVRVDFFKESGKWYTTEEMQWLIYDGKTLIHDAFIASLRARFRGRNSGMTAVCLEPYHEHAHPIMLHRWDEQQPTQELPRIIP